MTEKVKQETAAGGVVYSYDNDHQLRFVLIQDKYSNWGFPKGHLEADETEAAAAQREITEEVGLQCEIGPLVGRIEYMIEKSNQMRHKTVAYFLAPSAYSNLSPQTDEGIGTARWVSAAEAIQLITFEQVRGVLRRALALIAADEKPA